MANINVKTLSVLLLALTVASCGKNADDQNTQSTTTDLTNASLGSGAGDVKSAEWTESAELQLNTAQAQGANTLATVLDPNEIPYPLYPNGSRYRIGGEGDLKIVLFQTEDSFEEVDAYYQREANLPRLSAMSDYVRYSTDNEDIDPWATSKPGIVIHQFNDAQEREAVGADVKAKTNIIMSFE